MRISFFSQLKSDHLRPKISLHRRPTATRQQYHHSIHPGESCQQQTNSSLLRTIGVSVWGPRAGFFQQKRLIVSHLVWGSPPRGTGAPFRGRVLSSRNTRGGMPLIRDQLKSDSVTPRLTAHSTFEFRPIVALIFVVAMLGAEAMALFEQGLSALVAAGVSLSVALVGLYRLRKERALLSDYQLAVATVSQRIVTEIDAGYSYSVRYRFLGSDEKVYVGTSGSTGKVLPQEGGTVPILYRRSDPSQNSTLATFWFYRFTYTGTE
jgi:hypothetical protein